MVLFPYLCIIGFPCNMEGFPNLTTDSSYSNGLSSTGPQHGRPTSGGGRCRQAPYRICTLYATILQCSCNLL